MPFRTDVRDSPNLFTNTTGATGTQRIVSLTGTTAYDIYINGVQGSYHDPAANNNNSPQKLVLRIGSTVVWRDFLIGNLTAFSRQFVYPIFVPAGSSCGATLSVSAAGQTCDVTLLYSIESR